MNRQISLITQGKGPTITLLHGWGMNSAIFKSLVNKLSAMFEVVCVDLPGHGQSDWSENMGFDQQVEMLEQVLPRSSIVGWSLGGLFATRLANNHPEKFKRLILLSSNPCFVQKPDWLCAVERSVFDEFSRSMIDNWQLTVRRFIGLQMHGSQNSRGLIKRMTQLLIEGGHPHPDALRMGLQLLLGHDSRSELAAVTQPVLSILGARDTLAPKCLAQKLALINSRIRVECLADSAHVPFVSHSELVADLLREFIESTPA